MKKLRAGIIGCGNIFPMHAVSVMEQENAELAAVCDMKEELAKKASEQYHCNYYVDYKKMIDTEKLDVLHICTPHYLHPEMALYAAKKGVNILTEKPMAIRLEDAYAMHKAAKDHHVILQVSFQNRYNPGSLLIKETLASGELGKIFSARFLVAWNRSDEYYSKSEWKGTWDKEGGGVMIDQAIHTLDLMNWFIGSEIDYVEAAISRRAHDIIKVEDCAEGVISYRNGIRASFYAMNYNTYDAPVEIELHCEKGIAKLTGEKAIISFTDNRQYIADRNPNEVFHYGEVKQYWGVSHRKEIENLYHCLLTGERPRNTAEEVMSTQELVCAIYQSGIQKKRIYWRELKEEGKTFAKQEAITYQW